MLQRSYLFLRAAALRLGVRPEIYQGAGRMLRSVSGLSETLVEDVRSADDRRFAARFLAPWQDEGPGTEAESRAALAAALAERPAGQLADRLVRGLRRIDSRPELRFARFLAGSETPALAQAGRLLLADRAIFWRDFHTAEAEAEAYLADPDSATEAGTDMALGLLVSAKRRLGKLDEALALNRTQMQRAPLDKEHLVRRARMLALEDPSEMLRLLKRCDAEYADAGLSGNTLWCAHLLAQGEVDEVERLARVLEMRLPGNRLARALLVNAQVQRDGEQAAIVPVFETLGLECTRDGPGFDGLRLARPHEVPDAGPLVSIVMTAYNAEAHIGTAIGAILAQSYRRFELIVVDDCSGDATAERVREIAARDGRVRLMSTKVNGGTYLAKNAGIRTAKGAFVTLCDSDDMWTTDHLAAHLAAMQADAGRTVSTSDWLRLFDDCRVDINPTGTIVEVCPHSTFFRREVFDRVGLFDSVRFGADREFIARITLEWGQPAVHHIPRVLTIGRRHDASLTTSGAGMLGPDQKSDTRLEYWRIWNAWHAARVAEAAPLYNSGTPDERPYEVPAEMIGTR
ncbi:truncated glycosyltransferase [Oceanicola granulosus HTCC2516]|uniref:Truncated glycosyltransferase n=1 Tax=Oceanicola granulosus (strain ATCC BAA-861 / DSM 15982 / KCTC 12143 / HTCC2516) TaxID=314256 RepID=Q2CBS3_OCEGH|nr:glycosyltransferase family A protein [Oceanicola granulosus]EAR50131.1 truncated glycosyltransferase [Oceanicola granulosus HTCC2516]